MASERRSRNHVGRQIAILPPYAESWPLDVPSSHSMSSWRTRLVVRDSRRH
jgi:hypothetical protein